MTGARWLNTAYAHPDEVPDDRWAHMMMTRDEYAAMVRERSERDQLAPAPGTRAPDFEAARLGPDGALSGETFQLHASLEASGGRPVGLVFGSYT